MQVEVKDLSMSYNDAGREVSIFNALNFDLRSGTSLAIIGESGVGKTTLLYLLGALEHPTAGDVQIDGQSLRKLRESGADMAVFRGANVGFIFQFHQLLAEFDAVENVAMPLLIVGESFAKARKRASELLVRVGLSHRLSHRPGALSGGEQQRVAIARALVRNPGVILADEPTGSLDQRTALEVRKLLFELQREEKKTLIVVTHSLELAESMDQVMELTNSGMREHKKSMGEK